MYPRLIIDTQKIAQNVRTVSGMLHQRGLRCIGVTKGACCLPQIARTLADNGVDALGDSRIENLMKIQDLAVEKWLIRGPMASDADRVVRYADLSLNSEVSTLRALEEACARQDRTHKVVLMMDLGDLREGFISEDELMAAAEECMAAPHLQLAGVGANLTCLSFIQADAEKLTHLCQVAQRLQERFGLEDMIVSGGNSATLHLMMTEGLPAGITDLRLGESLLFGRERACYEYLPGTSNDAFVMEVEVIEAKRKPSMPFGTVGPDSYGVIHQFQDLGERVRAVTAGGSQDFDIEVMWPEDERVKVVGSSCDHTVLDITECAQDYPAGSIVRLRCGYHAALHACTSAYVEKVFE